MRLGGSDDSGGNRPVVDAYLQIHRLVTPIRLLRTHWSASNESIHSNWHWNRFGIRWAVADLRNVEAFLAHAEYEVVEALVVDALQRPLHGQGELHQQWKMFPIIDRIHLFLSIKSTLNWRPQFVRYGCVTLIASVMFNPLAAMYVDPIVLILVISENCFWSRSCAWNTNSSINNLKGNSMRCWRLPRRNRKWLHWGIADIPGLGCWPSPRSRILPWFNS